MLNDTDPEVALSCARECRAAFDRASSAQKLRFLQSCANSELVTQLLHLHLCDYNTTATVPSEHKHLQNESRVTAEKIFDFTFFLGFGDRGAGGGGGSSVTKPMKESADKRARIDKARLPNGETKLHTAAKKGKVEKVKKLLKKGADTNYLCAAGLSALWEAADNGHVEVVRLLLKAGAHVDHVHDGETPLYRVTRCMSRGTLTCLQVVEKMGEEDSADWRAIAQALLQHGANPDISINGSTPRVALQSSGLLSQSHGGSQDAAYSVQEPVTMEQCEVRSVAFKLYLMSSRSEFNF